MKERKSLKLVVAIATVIGASTLLFQGFIQASTTTEFLKSETIPTSYASVTNESSKNPQHEGYQKAHYKVGEIDLDYYRNQSPTSKDLTKEEAAEIGAQALWEVFDVHLEGQTIELGYNPPAESLPRSSWYADVHLNDSLSYFFQIDAVTGELFNLGLARTLDKEVPLGFDQALDKNPQEYVDLAKKLAEKYRVVSGQIKSVEYNNQGYSNNDPDVTMYVTGDNGEQATMTFSRFDQALLTIGFHTPTKYAKEYSEKQVKQLQEKVKELENTTPSDNENETPFLKAIELD